MKSIVKYGKWAGAVTAIIIALVTINQYRFWASATDLQQVAGVSYGTAIGRQSDNLIRVRLLIAECEANSGCSNASMENLRQQEAAILLRIRQLETDEARLQ